MSLGRQLCSEFDADPTFGGFQLDCQCAKLGLAGNSTVA